MTTEPLTASEHEEVSAMSDRELAAFWNVCQWQRRLQTTPHRAEEAVSAALTARSVPHTLNRRTITLSAA